MKKQQLLSLSRAAAPYIFCLALCVVAAHAQASMPLDSYAPDVQGITRSQLIRRILGAAVALLGIGFAMRQHDVNKSVVVGVGFGIALALNADTLISWMG
ncbi:MAG: TrbC/VirB2 family protein [Bryobacteraceae bacterium]